MVFESVCRRLFKDAQNDEVEDRGGSRQIRRDITDRRFGSRSAETAGDGGCLTRMDVSIVIVNWNSRERLRSCLDSIFARPPSCDYEVVVIDSASFDGCEQLIRDGYSRVQFIQSLTNVGFAKANNRAARASSGRCLLFLNPDTEVVGSAIDLLHGAVISISVAGLVGPTLLNADGSVQSTCIRAIPTMANRLLDCEFSRRVWPRSYLWGMRPFYEQGSTVRDVEAISGACMMVTRAVFERVGGFSEDYFMYAEDMDLAYKVREAGYHNYYVPAASVTHHGGGSSREASGVFAAVMMPEATWRFFKKRRGHLYGLGYRAGMLVSAALRLVALGLAWPLWALVRRPGLPAPSLRKWFAILKWSIGCDHLARRYYLD